MKPLEKSLAAGLKQLKIERDWLADQVEIKSIEVLRTITELIKKEKNN